MGAARGRLVDLLAAEGADARFGRGLLCRALGESRLERCGLLDLVELVEGFHDGEHGGGGDEEVDDSADEGAEVHDVSVEVEREAGDLGAAARDERDERLDNVAHERVDHGGEPSADDDADGQVRHVAAVDELLEFLGDVPECQLGLLSCGVRPCGGISCLGKITIGKFGWVEDVYRLAVRPS